MRHWTDEDIETLMRLYRSHGPTELAAILGRTPRAVLDKWRYERYKALPGRRRRWWTDEEEALLRQMYHYRHGPKRVAQALGRTVRAVYRKAYYMGLANYPKEGSK